MKMLKVVQNIFLVFNASVAEIRGLQRCAGTLCMTACVFDGSSTYFDVVTLSVYIRGPLRYKTINSIDVSEVSVCGSVTNLLTYHKGHTLH